MASQRIAAWTLAVVSLALTVTGVVLAATDPNPAETVRDPLALNGYPPRTADIAVVVSTGQAYQVRANVEVNFVANTAEATVAVPLVFSAAQFDLRLVDNHLYVGSSNFASVFGKPWTALPAGQPSLFGASLEMVKPDVALITGLDRLLTTKSGYQTTYRFRHRGYLSTSSGTQPVAFPARTTLNLSITVGRQGEVNAASLSLATGRTTLTLTATVLSYNQPVHVAVPRAADVKDVRGSALTGLFQGTAFAQLLSPSGWDSFFSSRLS